MCILFVYKASQASTKSLPYKLILASNRDELLGRPTKEASFWENSDSEILGGRDLQAGGTWLAINKATGKLGILLSIMGGTKQDLNTSRGSIVTNFLRSPKHLTGWTYCKNLTQDPSLDIVNNFSLFNLVTIDLLENGTTNTNNLVEVNDHQQRQQNSRDQINQSSFPSLTYFSNYIPNSSDPKSTTKEIELELDPEQINTNYFSIGNSLYNKPFKKTEIGKTQFEQIVNSADSFSTDELKMQLLEFLKSTQKHYPDVELQRQGHGKSEETLQGLSSIYLEPANFNYLYGTRTHTITLVDHDNNVDFHEWTLAEIPTSGKENVWKESYFKFQLGTLTGAESSDDKNISNAHIDQKL